MTIWAFFVHFAVFVANSRGRDMLKVSDVMPTYCSPKDGDIANYVSYEAFFWHFAVFTAFMQAGAN